MLPLIAPGVASGALFAFVTSFDEVVVALFIAGSEQRTLPRQMWSGVREIAQPDHHGGRDAADRGVDRAAGRLQWLQGRAARASTRLAAPA